jgi:hypothetical protein
MDEFWLALFKDAPAWATFAFFIWTNQRQRESTMTSMSVMVEKMTETIQHCCSDRFENDD